MNIKEFTNIFDEETIEKISGFSKTDKCGFKLLIDNGKITIYLGRDKVEVFLIEDSYGWGRGTLKNEDLNLIFKIKTQWENYVSNKNSYKSAFNELMEADEIFKHLEKMCEVTE